MTKSLQGSRILIADDHAIVREGLRALITADAELELVGEAQHGREAVEKAQALKPDVILMDLVMPRLSGVDAIRQIRQPIITRPGPRSGMTRAERSRILSPVSAPAAR